MRYSNVTEGIFLSRPNRFIAYVEINGITEVCHVKNTGRCKELLIPGVKVFLEISDTPSRKTKYDLIAVYKGDVLINIDSQAPNKVFAEWVKDSGIFGKDIYIKPECKYKNSRFDFYIEAGSRRIFVEVKGVTLERDGVLLFPDAPTERGVKHLSELVDAAENGYEAYVFFIIQMEKCLYFTPNRETHPAFADTLRIAAEKGVKAIALTCSVRNDELKVLREAEIRI